MAARQENDDLLESLLLDEQESEMGAPISANQESQETSCTSSPPSRLVVQGIFLLLGIGILAPWNAFISAKDYFDKRLCNSTSNLESKFSLIYNLASVTSLGLLILVQTLSELFSAKQRHARQQREHRRTDRPDTLVPENHDELEQDGILRTHESAEIAKKDHSSSMVMLPLALYLAAFLGQAVMVRVITMPFFLSFTFLGLALCGMACSVAQAGIVATAGSFPSELAMNPYLEGMSLGGVAVSVANFISSAYGDSQSFWDAHCTENRMLESCNMYHQVDEAVFVYFFLGVATLGLCMIGFSYIVRLRRQDGEYGYYESVQQNNGVVDQQTESPPVIAGLELQGRAVEEASDGARIRVTDSDLVEWSLNETADVWKEIKGPAACIFLVFALTLSLFPAWTSQLRSVHQCDSTSRMANDLFTPMSFVIFNVGDLAGRILSSRLSFSSEEHRSRDLVRAAALRFLFLVLLYFCPGGNRSPLIESDVNTVLVQFAMAVSNGFLLSAAFCHAPSLIPSVPELQERMGEILNFSVSLGLLVGSLLSFPVATFMSG